MASKSGTEAASKPVRRKSAPAPIVVDAEERLRLIEDSAFFRAGCFRLVEPGRIRDADFRAAAADVDAVIKAPRARRKK